MTRLVRHCPCPRRRQRGVIVLLLLAGLAVAVLGVFLGSISSTALGLGRDKQTTQALAQAKEALIGRAAADDNRPGSLPCPDIITNVPGTNVPNDGKADLLAGTHCPSYIGRLPWRTLGLPDLRDGDGERLWYVLSTSFRDDDLAQPVNSDTSGQLTVTGSSSMINVVAIVFAPGTSLASQGQVRDTAGQNNVGNYLEGENANGDTTYVSSPASDSVNDRLLVISQEDLFSVVEKRVANEVKAALNKYYSDDPLHFYPNPAAFNDPSCLGTAALPGTSCLSDAAANRGRIPANPVPAWTLYDPTSILRGGTPNWFQQNGWRELVYYAVAPACATGSSNCLGLGGFLTMNQTSTAPLNNQKIVLVVAGRVLSGASRSSVGEKGVEANYLEGENLAPLDNVYLKATITGAFNDRTSSIP
jgi:hypothetical protein